MGRIARVVLPGHPHHVTQRGVRSMNVFRNDEDRHQYLQLLAWQCDRTGSTILSYCLMSNHIHLVVVPPDENALARTVGETHRRYTRYVNFSENVRGHLFQARFYSCPMDEHHLLSAVRYVERNPVHAKLVRVPWRYPWSTAAFHAGLKATDVLVTDRTLAGLVDDDEWRDLLRSDPDDAPEIQEKTRTGRPCGDDAFVKLAEKSTGRSLQPRPPGRHRKAKRTTKK